MFVCTVENINLKGFKAFIPGITFGNVGQLAMDLLISTTRAHKIGCIWHEGVLPLVGSNAIDKNDLPNLSISTEIYAYENKKSVFIQIRAPILMQLEESFRQSIFDWLIAHGVKSLVVLVSAEDLKIFPSQRENSESIRFYGGVAADNAIINLLKQNECLEAASEEIEVLKVESCTRLPMAFLVNADEIRMPCVLIIKYCEGEGDNQPEALKVAYLLDNIYALFPPNNDVSNEKHVVVPPSWDLLFGNASPLELFN